MFRKIREGGFVLVEFALALPLIILLAYGLATMGAKFFEIGKMQLADYVLEEEVHDVLSRLIYDARTAKTVEAYNNLHRITFTYRTINDNYQKFSGEVISDELYPRVYMVVGMIDRENSNINYKRKTADPTNPITGKNFFGNTRVTDFTFSKLQSASDKEIENVLHVTLEMQSEVTAHKIRINTAIYMPSCEEFTVDGK